MSGGSPPLLSLRATVVLLLAVMTGLVAGTLAHLGGQAVPAATLVGGGAAGGALLIFHAIVGR